MTQDNTRREWQAHCVTWEGERIEWRGLRHGQALWRYQFLRRGMRWRGKELRACGYSLEGEAIA